MKKRTRAALACILFGDIQAEVRNAQIASFIPTEQQIQKLIVGINPVQDLHGYDYPWPAGGGKNICPDMLYPSSSNGVYFGEDANTSFPFAFIAGTTYTLSTTCTKYFDVYLRRSDEGVGVKIATAVKSVTFTPSVTGNYRLAGFLTNGLSVSEFTNFQVEVGSSATPWTPYSNICPISGFSDVDIFREATYDPAASPYVTISLGTTVYGGRLDVVNGKVYARPYYSSYNGETLVGPWVSSMDKYEEGATPTMGAQVVDMGGAVTEISLTPVQINTLMNTRNYVWADSGPIIDLIS